MKYKSEFHVKGDSGTQIASSNRLPDLLQIMENRGWDKKNVYVNKIMKWDNTGECKKFMECHLQL